ncbi:MAG TPA: hypothetical protein VG735_07830 [Caulobacterales bacterium]|nr:hypothetical protein [Caulobacterales bacterium]
MKLTLSLKTLDGTLSIRRENDCFVVGIARDDRIKPLEFPPLRPSSAAALRTIIDDALEAEAKENEPCIA